MDIHKILEFLPHRYPFVLIDRVEYLDKGKSIIALKNVSINEPYFVGHFPGNPVMPGVLMLEAMAQAGGILALETTPEKVLYYFAGIDNVRFKHIVTPGDQLRLYVTAEKSRQNVWKLKGKAMVDDKLACSADFMIAGRKERN
jgi:3-hydroxyacyl-[acyl-carrier-protein] dehydratase